MAPYRAIDSLTDLVLLVLRANEHRGGRHLAGVTRLQKLLFLITESGAYKSLESKGLAPHVRFEPYRMGPFTPEVYEAVQVLTDFEPPLIAAGASTTQEQDVLELGRYVEEVALDDATSSPLHRPATFALTKSGRTVADRLWRDADTELRNEIAKTVERFSGMPLRSLLREVYALRPDMTTRSEIRESLGLGASEET